jgi:hypothetical protein
VTALSTLDGRVNIRVIAGELKLVQDLCKQIESMTGRLSGFHNSVAYDVQRLIHEARVRDGMRPVGERRNGDDRIIDRSAGDSSARDVDHGYRRHRPVRPVRDARRLTYVVHPAC